MQQFSDTGKTPFIQNMIEMAKQNTNYREAIWTGEEMQVTLMSIPAGHGDIGMEIHPTHDQLLFLAAGTGTVQMGDHEDHITIKKTVKAGDTVIVPKNIWHNITNSGDAPMQVISVYAPVQHPAGIVQEHKPS